MAGKHVEVLTAEWAANEAMTVKRTIQVPFWVRRIRFTRAFLFYETVGNNYVENPVRLFSPTLAPLINNNAIDFLAFNNIPQILDKEFAVDVVSFPSGVQIPKEVHFELQALSIANPNDGLSQIYDVHEAADAAHFALTIEFTN